MEVRQVLYTVFIKESVRQEIAKNNSCFIMASNFEAENPESAYSQFMKKYPSNLKFEDFTINPV